MAIEGLSVGQKLLDGRFECEVVSIFGDHFEVQYQSGALFSYSESKLRSGEIKMLVEKKVNILNDTFTETDLELAKKKVREGKANQQITELVTMVEVLEAMGGEPMYYIKKANSPQEFKKRVLNLIRNKYACTEEK